LVPILHFLRRFRADVVGKAPLVRMPVTVNGHKTVVLFALIDRNQNFDNCENIYQRKLKCML